MPITDVDCWNAKVSSCSAAAVVAPALPSRSDVTDRRPAGSSRSPYPENQVSLRLQFGNGRTVRGFRTRQTLS